VVISGLGPGGSERVATELCNHWLQRRWNVTLITLTGDGDAPFFSLRHEVELLRLGVSGPSASVPVALIANLRRVRRLRRAFRACGADAIVSFGDRMNVLALFASLGLTRPVVVSERSNPILNDPGRYWRALRRLLYPLAAAVTVQTEGAACF